MDVVTTLLVTVPIILSQSQSSEIEGCSGTDVQHANTLGCMAGLTLALVSVAAANGHTVRGVSERGPVINQGPHQIQN